MARFLGILLLMFVSTVMAVPSCPAVNTRLSPCLTYMEVNHNGSPSGACCAGVMMVAEEGQTNQDKIAICNCIKQSMIKLGNRVVPSRMTGIPENCGLTLTIPTIDAHYDCNSMISWME